jgi:tripartite-type tricarboxylate transporter receptor subunit TctC
MTSLRVTACAMAAGISLCQAPAAICQDFPQRPLRIVASGIGGGNDLVARIIAQALSGAVAQPVIVENRGGGVNAAEIVAKAQPDGYTLLLYGSTLWLSPFMRDHTPYDPIRDFAPVTLTTRAPNVLVVHPSVAATSVKELIALAKARPGALDYASGATGASNHLAGELFSAMAGVKIVRIGYKGIGPAVADLLGGHVQLSFATAGAVAPHVKSGKLRALGVTSAQPSALFPGIAPIAAAGLSGYEAVAVSAVFAPAKTPVAVIRTLNREIVRVLAAADTRDKFLALGVEAVGTTPEQLAASVKSEMLRMGKVIKDAGIREE